MIINICLVTDDNYARHCGVAITSALYNSAESDHLHFYILYNNLSPQSKYKLQKLKFIDRCTIEFIHVDSERYALYPMPKGTYISLTACLKISLASILSHLDKILYLDCDLIVEDSLEPLYNLDLNGYYGAMAIDLPAQWRKKALEMDQNYHNSGVILINCDLWREDHLESKMLQWAAQNEGKMNYVDQDTINVITDGRIKTLDSKYNAFEYRFNLNDSNEKLVIVHLVGRLKPWNPFSRKPSSIEYFKYLRYTEWNTSKYFHFIHMLPKAIMLKTTEILKQILSKNSPVLYNRVRKLYSKYFKKNK